MRLSNFVQSGPASLPVNQLAADRELARDVQVQLGVAGVLEPPADGQFGPVSQWALAAFCARAGLAYDGALSRPTAEALVAPGVAAVFLLAPGDDLAGRIVAAMARHGYWFSRHPECLTIVYIEGMDLDGTANANTANAFNDARLLLGVDAAGTPSVVHAWDGTTEPGRTFTEQPLDAGGAARIAFGQYKSWVIGTHHAGTSDAHEALVQVADVSVCRDLNKDYSRDGDAVRTGQFGINQHWGYDLPANNVSNASAGCLLGRTKQGHRDFMAALKTDARYQANSAYRFMTAVLPVANLAVAAPVAATSMAPPPLAPPAPPAPPAPSALPDDWIETALKVTGHFEDSDDPMGAVSGDFDGQGISLGVLQWNIGQGSLQPMVRAIGRARVVALLPQLGTEFWTACTSDIPAGLAIVRGWQSGGALRPAARAELRDFTRSAEFTARQVAAARVVATSAWRAAGVWAADSTAPGGVSKALFCWFFDLYTQNGGLKGLTFADVAAFIAGHGAEGAVAAVCDWLPARPADDPGAKEAGRNAALFPTLVGETTRPLLLLSYLRAQLSNIRWRTDTMNRKATIALGQGWVHGERHDVRSLLGM